MRLINFDFIIKHRFEKINFIDDSSRRFNYHDVNMKITRFLFILQTKLRIIVFLHIQFSNVRAIIVALFAKISRIDFNKMKSRDQKLQFLYLFMYCQKNNVNATN
jgi:hypothetical protein